MIDHVLYRMYGERVVGSGEELLYVGVTINPSTRVKNHSVKWWWPKVNRIALERFATRQELLAAEIAEIRSQQPYLNIAGNPHYHYSPADCVTEAHPEMTTPGQLCADCESAKAAAWRWLEEEQIEYEIWYREPKSA